MTAMVRGQKKDGAATLSSSRMAQLLSDDARTIRSPSMAAVSLRGPRPSVCDDEIIMPRRMMNDVAQSSPRHKIATGRKGL